MLREARLLFDQCDCKHNLLLTARLEAVGAVNTRGDQPVSMALGRSTQPGSLMVETCWLEAFFFLVMKLLSISRCSASVL